MKYFLDTEFIEDGKTIDLISIGIVAEDGREFYAIKGECDFGKASDWVLENVLLPIGLDRRGVRSTKLGLDDFDSLYLYRSDPFIRPKNQIKEDILNFCLWRSAGFTPYDSYNKVNVNNYDRLEPEFWGYYADYGWVVFCQLFGKMIDLPSGFPMYCRDIKQLCDELGNPELPKQLEGEHNALLDAKWNKEAYEFLIKLKGGD